MNPLAALALPTVDVDLARFEPLLAESVVIGDTYLDQVTTHLIRAGGKRLRPLLAFAAATGGATEASQDVLLGGVSLELMHLASLAPPVAEAIASNGRNRLPPASIRCVVTWSR